MDELQGVGEQHSADRSTSCSGGAVRFSEVGDSLGVRSSGHLCFVDVEKASGPVVDAVGVWGSRLQRELR